MTTSIYHWPTRDGDTAKVSFTFEGGWAIWSPETADLFGTPWLPLPFTPEATEAEVKAGVSHITTRAVGAR